MKRNILAHTWPVHQVTLWWRYECETSWEESGADTFYSCQKL